MKYPQAYIENISHRSVSPQTEIYMLRTTLHTFFASLAAGEKTVVISFNFNTH